MANSSARCVHGIDSRFCAVCNKVSAFGRPQAAIASATLAEILAFLDAEQARATRRAVADLLGISPAALGDRLGDREAEHGDPDAIPSGTALAMRMTAWKATRPSG